MFRRPLGTVHLAVTIVTCLVLLEGESVPAGRFSQGLGAGFALLVLGAVYVVRLVAFAWLRRGTSAPWALGRWVAAPLSVALTAGLLAYDGPLRVRVLMSRPALDRFAARTMTAPPGRPTPGRRWVGLFPVQDAETIPGGMRFVVPDTGFLDRGGLAHFEGGPPPGTRPRTYLPLGGPWFEWIEDF